MSQDRELEKSRRISLLTAGLVSGFAVYLAVTEPKGFDKDIVLALIVGLFYGAHTLLLTGHAGRLRTAITASLGVFAGVGLLAFQYFRHIGFDAGLAGMSDARADFALSLHFAFFLGLIYLQTLREGQGLAYPALFSNACRNLVLGTLPFTLVGLVFLALGMISELFKVIGIDLLSRLMQESWFHFSFGGLVYGLTILYLRENEKTMLAAIRFSLAMFRIVGMLIGGAALVFLLCLPFVGLDPLWESRMAASMLLTLVVVTGFHANAYIEDGDGAAWGKVGRMRQGLITASIAVLPLYIGLAAYAFWLRIGQHGLTPDRVYALPILIMSGAFALGYLYHIVRYRLDWVHHAGRVNIPLTILSALIAIALHLAPISAYRIAADSQMSRLQSGKVAADDFDYGALKFSMAKPGRERFDALLADDATLARLGFSRSMDDLRALKSPYEPRTGMRPILLKDIRVLPEGADISPAVDAGLLAALSGEAIDCADRNEGKHVCTLWAVDMTGDGQMEYIWITDLPYNQSLEVYDLRQEEGKVTLWRYRLLDNPGYRNADFIKAIEAGTFTFFRPRMPAFMVNGDAFQLSPEAVEATSEEATGRK